MPHLFKSCATCNCMIQIIPDWGMGLIQIDLDQVNTHSVWTGLLSWWIMVFISYSKVTALPLWLAVLYYILLNPTMYAFLYWTTSTQGIKQSTSAHACFPEARCEKHGCHRHYTAILTISHQTDTCTYHPLVVHTVLTLQAYRNIFL